jgi:serine/threonine protein phosphatase PrpC
VSEDLWIYGVFDGHGKQGHDVSDFVAAILPRILIGKLLNCKPDGVKQVLEDAFEETCQHILTQTQRSRIDGWEAGTTATIIVHDRKLCKITVAHVGDSGACLGREVAPGSCLQRCFGSAAKPFLALTQDHKPQNKEEQKRIECAGGSIVFDGYFNYRVFVEGKDYPGLNMSRALGDVKGHLEAGISAKPTVAEFKLDARDKELILCSDGVWEFMTPEDVTNHVSERRELPLSECVESLARESQERWLQEEGDVVDDITAIIVCL